MMLGSIVIYVLVLLLSLWVVSRFIKSKKAKWVVFIIWLLIPTWDVILGYPIYWYLCKYEAGIKIYKTVDNVEGFYIGEQSKKYEPYWPYEGYRYIEYKETETGKYFRSYWIDNNTSAQCIPIGVRRYSPYAEAFAKGHCIAKEEISKRNVSQWYFNSNNIIGSYLGGFTAPIIIPILNFTHQTPFVIQDTTSAEKLGQLDYYWWSGGWLFRRFSSFSSGSGGVDCGFKEEDEHPARTFVNTILKPKKGISDGNN